MYYAVLETVITISDYSEGLGIGVGISPLNEVTRFQTDAYFFQLEH